MRKSHILRLFFIIYFFASSSSAQKTALLGGTLPDWSLSCPAVFIFPQMLKSASTNEADDVPRHVMVGSPSLVKPIIRRRPVVWIAFSDLTHALKMINCKLFSVYVLGKRENGNSANPQHRRIGRERRGSSFHMCGLKPESIAMENVQHLLSSSQRSKRRGEELGSSPSYSHTRARVSLLTRCETSGFWMD